MVTIKSIAEKLNLSSATVSRALRNDETLSIAPDTRARILTAAEEMGYVRPLSKTAVTPSEKRLLVIHKYQTFRNQIDSSYYFAIRSGIEDACAKQKIRCTFLAIEDLPASLDPTDGILVVGNYTKDQFDSLLGLYKNIPIVTIGIVSYYPERIDQVTYSNYDSVTLGMNFLFQNGHTKIAYLGVQEAPGAEKFGSRKQCFIDLMREKNLLKEEWIHEIDHGRDRVERGFTLMKSLLQKKAPLPTAFFCANDPIALGAMNALLESGFRIPDDISILSHDGSFPTQYSFPPLTTVDVHPYQLGLEGVSVLLNRMEEPQRVARRIHLYPELIVRGSVQDISCKNQKNQINPT